MFKEHAILCVFCSNVLETCSACPEWLANGRLQGQGLCVTVKREHELFSFVVQSGPSGFRQNGSVRVSPDADGRLLARLVGGVTGVCWESGVSVSALAKRAGRTAGTCPARGWSWVVVVCVLVRALPLIRAWWGVGVSGADEAVRGLVDAIGIGDGLQIVQHQVDELAFFVQAADGLHHDLADPLPADTQVCSNLVIGGVAFRFRQREAVFDHVALHAGNHVCGNIGFQEVSQACPQVRLLGFLVVGGWHVFFLPSFLYCSTSALVCVRSLLL